MSSERREMVSNKDKGICRKGHVNHVKGSDWTSSTEQQGVLKDFNSWMTWLHCVGDVGEGQGRWQGEH